jgi:hypothetical protein
MGALKVVRAVLVGYLAMAALAMAGLLALSAAIGGGSASVPPPHFVISNLLWSTVAAGIGGWICARMAPAGRVLIAVSLLFFLVLAVGAVLGRAAATPTQPLWYQALLTLLGASGVLMGAVIERSQAATRARRAER